MTDYHVSELFTGAQMESPQILKVNGGEVAVFGRGSPDKENHNEDSMAVLSYGDFMTVLVVADGLGGSRDGAQASALAVRELKKAIAGAENDMGSPRAAILNGVEAANQSLLERGSGSATTIVVVAIAKDFLRTYHVGDSGMVQVGQRGRIKQQTVAHSPVGFAQASGMLNEEEALYHAERHLVSNTVGIAEMSIEIGPPMRLDRRDTVLLASDGLLDNLRLAEIVDRIRIGSIAKAATRLMTSAVYRMSNSDSSQPSKPDDLSFILYRRTS